MMASTKLLAGWRQPLLGTRNGLRLHHVAVRYLLAAPLGRVLDALHAPAQLLLDPGLAGAHVALAE